MIFLYIVLFVVVLSGFKVRDNQTDYLSKEQSNVVKGICLFLVFFRHAFQYMEKASMTSSINTLAFWLDDELGQMIVVMFLFFSGFGVMESIKVKGQEYVRTLPYKRVLSTLLNFDVAVVVFIIVNTVLHIKYPFGDYLFALTGWTSIGNSNWYIFVIILCYVVTWLSFRITRRYNSSSISCIVLWFSSFLLFVALFETKQSWWYDSVFCYPLGVTFSCVKPKYDKLSSNPKRWIFLLLVTMFSFSIAMIHSYSIEFTLARNLLLALLVVQYLRKVEIRSKVFEWVGSNLFPLYIYQRIPMIILSAVGGILFSRPFLFLFVSLIITAMLGYLFRFIKISFK